MTVQNPNAPSPGLIYLAKQFLGEVQLKSHHDAKEFFFYPSNRFPGWAVDVESQWGRPNDREMIVKLRFVLRYPESDAPSPRPIDLSMEVIGVFQAHADISHEQAEAFVHDHSAAALWLFAQESLALLTTRAGGPAFVLGPLADAFTPADTATA